MPTTPSADEPLDIRELTEENIDDLAEMTGRSVKALRKELLHAYAVNRKVFILVNNPIFRPRRPRAKLEDCDYDATWSNKVGWTYICRIHKKPSWHSVTEFPNAPCTAIDPKPADI